MNKHKQFIKDAYEGKYLTMCDKWKSEILKHYPEFGYDIKVGDYVIGKNGYLPRDFRLVSSVNGDMARYNDPNLGKGENNGTRIPYLRKATPEEVAKIQEEEIKEGDWVRFSGAHPPLVVVPPKGEKAYGFGILGLWTEEYRFWDGNLSPNIARPATSEEVESRLREEAVRRGLDKKEFDSLITVKSTKVSEITEWYYEAYSDRMYTAQRWRGGKVVYNKGKWAVPYKTITKEEAEELLGKKIL